jgi:hypothetical protein
VQNAALSQKKRFEISKSLGNNCMENPLVKEEAGI